MPSLYICKNPERKSFVLLILFGFFAYFNKASILGSRYAVSFTGTDGFLSVHSGFLCAAY